MAKAKRALTNAERQARYRQRHLRDIDGEKRRLSLFLDLHARRRLERIARHKRYTVTQLIEEWAAKAEQRLTARMTLKEEKAYFNADAAPGHRASLARRADNGGHDASN